MDVAKPYRFIGFGDIHDPTPYKFIGFGDIKGSGGILVLLDSGRHVTVS